MSRVGTTWKWLLAKAREGRAQLLLCLRVTLAAVASYVLAQFFAVPLAGLWAVFDGGHCDANERRRLADGGDRVFLGTFGGAIYAGVVGGHDPVS